METRIITTSLLCFGIAAFSISFCHFFNRIEYLPREMTLPERYIYGVVTIVTAPLMLMLDAGMIPAASWLFWSVVGAGGAYFGSVAWQHYSKARHKNMDLQRRINYATEREDTDEMGD